MMAGTLPISDLQKIKLMEHVSDALGTESW
jgi:hypothetical protein